MEIQFTKRQVTFKKEKLLLNDKAIGTEVIYKGANYSLFECGVTVWVWLVRLVKLKFNKNG